MLSAADAWKKPANDDPWIRASAISAITYANKA